MDNAMKKKTVTLIIVLTMLLTLHTGCFQGQAVVVKDYMNETKAAKDARMEWWREAQFGMFIHWGLYAVPAGVYGNKETHAEWILTTAQIPVEEYEKYAQQFNPVKFNADQWVRMAKGAGMKYIVITSKHHDGFGLWDSKVGDYDIMITPYKKDILKALSKACKRHGIKFCFYHSIMDWHHPDYLPRRNWEKRSAQGADFQRYITYMKAQIKELITEYDPEVLWFDGEWEKTWNNEEGVKLYNYVRSLKPDIIINNRVDKGRAGMQGLTKEGGFAGDFGTPEQEVPAGGLPGVDWESCITMNDHWGYCAADKNFKSTEFLIHQLVEITSKGGNYLLNIGPTSEGLFPPESVERLAGMGKWMRVNGEAIYGTTAWDKAKEAKKEKVVIERTEKTIDHDWGQGSPLKGIAKENFEVTWTGTLVPKHSEEYTFVTYSDDGVRLWIDGKKIIDNWSQHAVVKDIAKVKLEAGKKYSVKMDLYENSGYAAGRLLWSSQSQQLEPIKAAGGFKAVYKSDKPASADLFYTIKGETMYVITTKLPKKLTFEAPTPKDGATIRMLGTRKKLGWEYRNGKMIVDLSKINKKYLPCKHAWVFKID